MTLWRGRLYNSSFPVTVNVQLILAYKAYNMPAAMVRSTRLLPIWVDSASGIHLSTAGRLRAHHEPVHGATEAAETLGDSGPGSVRVPPLQMRQASERAPRVCWISSCAKKSDSRSCNVLKGEKLKGKTVVTTGLLSVDNCPILL